LRAPVSRVRGPRPPYLRIRSLFDFRENNRRFVFERCLHGLKITFGVLSGPVFKAKVSQVVVNRVAAFQQLVQFRPVRGEI
jgi:hypothetical protein